MKRYELQTPNDSRFLKNCILIVQSSRRALSLVNGNSLLQFFKNDGGVIFLNTSEDSNTRGYRIQQVMIQRDT